MRSKPFAILLLSIQESLSMKRIDLVKTGGFIAGEHLVVSNVPSPEPTDQQVVIDVRASAINPVDWKMAEYGFYLPEPLPAALGCDVAGVVVKAPSQELLGKRVVAYLGAIKTNHPTDRGAFCQQVAIDADVVGEIPDSLSFAAAATLPVGAMTAALLLNALSVEKDDKILVWGASSSVGYNTVQLAIRRGLKPIAIASGKHGPALQALGAAGFVDYTKRNVKKKVKDICGSDMLNSAVDCIGTPEIFGTCCELVGELGDASAERVVSTVSSFGLPEPPQGVKKSSVTLGPALDDPEMREKVVKATLPIMVELQTLPVRSIKGPFSAETVQEAFQTSKSGVSGEKVVIEWT